MCICYIVGASDIKKFDIVPKKGDLLIAADGGYVTMQRFNLEADIIIGDFDSAPTPKDRADKVIALKPEKDRTDIAEAIEIGKQKGYKVFRIYGGLGGKRLSHSIANIALIAALATRKTDAMLIGDDMRIRAITCDSVTLERGCRYLSIFAYGAEANVSLEGVKYPLSHYTLTPLIPLGISNEILDEAALITVHKGTIIIIEEF